MQFQQTAVNFIDLLYHHKHKTGSECLWSHGKLKIVTLRTQIHVNTQEEVNKHLLICKEEEEESNKTQSNLWAGKHTNWQESVTEASTAKHIRVQRRLLENRASGRQRGEKRNSLSHCWAVNCSQTHTDLRSQSHRKFIQIVTENS